MAVLEADIARFAYPFGNGPALKNVRLVVEPGEFVVMLGAAGAGKTTLCYCLTGVIPHHVEGDYEGDVVIDGVSVRQLRLPEIASPIGFVLQTPENQLFNLTVYEDVSFGPENLCLPVSEVRQRVRDSLSFVGMLAYAGRNPDTLSGGQAQRVVLASILAMPSEIYVLDQPAAELDPKGRRQVYESIAELNRSLGKTVIVVDDRLSDVAEFATRMILLHNGEIVADEPPSRLLTRRDLLDFGIRVPDHVRFFLGLRDAGLVLDGNLPGDMLLSVDPLLRLLREQRPWVESHAAGSREASDSSVEGGEVLLEIEDVYYSYPGHGEALRGVSFSARAGEIVVILGENGAGKTTLAKHIVGLLKPHKGRVRVDGVDTLGRSVAQLSRSVGFLFQDPDYQIFSASVYDEVAFGLRIRGCPQEEVEERVDGILRRLGLAAVRDLHPYRLSRGLRQKLALASVLVLEPRVLVVDEPSTGLDLNGTLEVMETLREYAGKALVVMVTHDVEMAIRFATRAIVMAQGEILLDVPVGRLRHHASVLHRAGIEMPNVLKLAEAIGHPSVSSVEQLVGLLRHGLLKGGDAIRQTLF